MSTSLKRLIWERMLELETQCVTLFSDFQAEREAKIAALRDLSAERVSHQAIQRELSSSQKDLTTLCQRVDELEAKNLGLVQSYDKIINQLKAELAELQNIPQAE